MAKMERLQPEVGNPIQAVLQNNVVDLSNYWYVEDLPSKYKLYPEGTKILARPLKTIEVKLLATLNPDNADYVINDILRKSIKGIEVEEILVADKLFLLFWLRANTYKDSGFKINFSCPHCNNKNATYEFKLDNLDVKEIKEDFDYNKEIELPVSKTMVRVSLQRIKDETRVKSFLNKNKNSLMNFDEDILSIANVITSINGKESRSLLNNYEFIFDLHPSDFSYIVSYIDHIDMGIGNQIHVSCEQCGGESPVGITFRPEFFVPKYRFE